MKHKYIGKSLAGIVLLLSGASSVNAQSRSDYARIFMLLEKGQKPERRDLETIKKGCESEDLADRATWHLLLGSAYQHSFISRSDYEAVVMKVSVREDPRTFIFVVQQYLSFTVTYKSMTKQHRSDLTRLARIEPPAGKFVAGEQQRIESLMRSGAEGKHIEGLCLVASKKALVSSDQAWATRQFKLALPTASKENASTLIFLQKLYIARNSSQVKPRKGLVR